MADVTGDVVIPKELIIPIASVTYTAQPSMSGAIYISGSYLYVRTKDKLWQLSGSNLL